MRAKPLYGSTKVTRRTAAALAHHRVAFLVAVAASLVNNLGMPRQFGRSGRLSGFFGWPAAAQQLLPLRRPVVDPIIDGLSRQPPHECAWKVELGSARNLIRRPLFFQCGLHVLMNVAISHFMRSATRPSTFAGQA
jgi:hypothetical protein